MLFQYFKSIKKALIFSLYIAQSFAFEIDEKGICHIDEFGYPAIGFGTYPLKNEICTKAVSSAARSGYRILDTATFYENFEAISDALKVFGRKNFYIISKIWPSEQNAEGLRADIQMTLNKLQTSYLDCYLLHWPDSKKSIKEILQTMQEFRTQGLIRHIGLSNVTVNHVKRALEIGINISWVQVEMHPYFYDKELLDFCKKHSITIQAWRPVDLGRVAEDKLLLKLGEKYKKTACQIALRWILQHGCIPLPGSKNEKHIQENLNIMDFSLTNEEMDHLNERAVIGKRFRLKEKHGLGFTDEFDFSYDQCWPT